MSCWAGRRGARNCSEPDSLQSGRVVAVRRDDVFIEFSGRQQGIASLRQFDIPPRPGAVVQVVVQRQNPEDGLYELSLPNKAVQVDDWSDLVEGALVEVRVTGHNAGGLECEVNHIRGFIPVSQISLYRVEDLAHFVDQRFTCVITEADPERRNLVVSRRAVLEREREQTAAAAARFASARPGPRRRGAEADGFRGLRRPRRRRRPAARQPTGLGPGQASRRRAARRARRSRCGSKRSIRPPARSASPIATCWKARGPPPPRNIRRNSVARGTVTKLMDFGAFVELEPGIEGLVHISELSHKRVCAAPTW